MDALKRIQKELKAPKGQHNSFGNYNYRSCEDILEAVKPLLNGAILTLSDEIVLIGDRFYVKATATITENDKSMSATAYARESLDKKGMDSAQITGAASSYARKYCLNGLFCIDDTKDADTMAHEEKSQPRAISATSKPIVHNSNDVICSCGAKMQKKTAKTGKYAGREFYGCSDYPNCKEMKKIEEVEKVIDVDTESTPF